MSKWIYLRDKLVPLLLNVTGIILVSLYLRITGNNQATIMVITIPWSAVLLLFFICNYRSRKQYFEKIFSQMEELEHAYLIGELMEDSWELNDQLYQRILRKSTKGMIEKIYQLEQEQQEYREFIEGWIHEVKLPITGIRLVTGRMETPPRMRLEEYMAQLESDVEKALFFARSEQVYKDFMIRKMSLQQLITALLRKDKYLMMQNNMSAEVNCEEDIVYSDAAWLDFILGQILLNAIKYRSMEHPCITFTTEEAKEGTLLSIRDNGMGIQKGEVERVFEKGFTGTNGRKKGASTGIGLYLCRKLCSKLGLEICAKSKEGEYTVIEIVFPKNSFLSKL